MFQPLKQLSACLVLGGMALFPSVVAAGTPSSTPTQTFVVSGNQFLLDGKPFQVLSGEMHYPRVPRAYWRDRFRMARAMGLNTITTYVFWNLHEPQPGVFDFTGQNDVAEYIREAQQEGLHVILRPGPYVCGEWELGGFPSWLLKDQGMALRTSDPKFVSAMQTWFTRLAKEINPLLLKNGGPIIAVQVENEYGSFGDDHKYMETVKSALQQSGLGADVLYTADPPDALRNGSLPELPAVINFGSGDAEKSFTQFASLRPSGPRMVGEYWSGWFDHWGGKHYKSNVAQEAAELESIVSRGYSISIYMFHGGTNFGWMNGANSDGTTYKPDTTSYDYDAALDEQGAPRQKYFAFRDAIARATKKTPPPVPHEIEREAFSISASTGSASLWRNLPQPVHSKVPLSMEDLDQSYGYVLYRSTLAEGDGGDLVLNGLHDYAQVYVGQALIGTIDRRLGQTHLALPVMKKRATLDILVENSGRVNFTQEIQNERKGLTGRVTLGGKEPGPWEIYSLPMDDLAKLHFLPETCEGPCFYRAQMTVPSPADTYLDTRGVHKGEAWINGHPLGRFWSIGPQFSLYAPAPWLSKGRNDIVFFDVAGTQSDTLKSIAKPVDEATTEVRE